MKRRSILEGAGKLSLVALLPAGAASAQEATVSGGGAGSDSHDDDCEYPEPYNPCWFNQPCWEITCPEQCCDCMCME